MDKRTALKLPGNSKLDPVQQVRQNGCCCALTGESPFLAAGQFSKGIVVRVDIHNGPAPLQNPPHYLIGQIGGPGSADHNEQGCS